MTVNDVLMSYIANRPYDSFVWLRQLFHTLCRRPGHGTSSLVKRITKLPFFAICCSISWRYSWRCVPPFLAMCVVSDGAGRRECYIWRLYVMRQGRNTGRKLVG